MVVKVYGNASVRDDAYVGDEAKVYGEAIVEGLSRVVNKACVWEDAVVKDNARIEDEACIKGRARIEGNGSVNRCVVDRGVFRGYIRQCDIRISDWKHQPWKFNGW